MVLESLNEIKESNSDSFAINVELSDAGEIQYLVIDNHRLKFKYIDGDKYVFTSGIIEIHGNKIDREVEIDKSKIENIENSFQNRFYIRNLYILDEYTIFTRGSKDLIIFDNKITNIFSQIDGLTNLIYTEDKYYFILQEKNIFDDLYREKDNVYVMKDNIRFSIVILNKKNITKKNNINCFNDAFFHYEKEELNDYYFL